MFSKQRRLQPQYRLVHRLLQQCKNTHNLHHYHRHMHLSHKHHKKERGPPLKQYSWKCGCYQNCIQCFRQKINRWLFKLPKKQFVVSTCEWQVEKTPLVMMLHCLCAHASLYGLWTQGSWMRVASGQLESFQLFTKSRVSTAIAWLRIVKSLFAFPS